MLKFKDCEAVQIPYYSALRLLLSPCFHSTSPGVRSPGSPNRS